MELVAEIADRQPDPAGAGPGAPRGDGSSEASAAEVKALIPVDAISDASDDRLVRAALVGQKEPFAELVRRYTRMVLWYVSGRISGQVEVEEITQEAIVRAYVGLPKLRAPRAFSGWLVAIADSIVREKHRMDSKIITLASPDGAAESPPEAAPAEVLSREELREQLLVEMRRLPPHYRTALALKYMNGYSINQISQQLQLPEGTVRARLSRAYGMLRKRLEPAVLGAEPGAGPENRSSGG